MKKTNRYTNSEKEKLMKNLKYLTTLERMVIEMRFWENMLIEEISEDLGLSWNQVDTIIENTLVKLRTKLIQDPIFKIRGLIQGPSFRTKNKYAAA